MFLKFATMTQHSTAYPIQNIVCDLPTVKEWSRQYISVAICCSGSAYNALPPFVSCWLKLRFPSEELQTTEPNDCIVKTSATLITDKYSLKKKILKSSSLQKINLKFHHQHHKLTHYYSVMTELSLRAFEPKCAQSHAHTYTYLHTSVASHVLCIKQTQLVTQSCPRVGHRLPGGHCLFACRNAGPHCSHGHFQDHPNRRVQLRNNDPSSLHYSLQKHLDPVRNNTTVNMSIWNYIGPINRWVVRVKVSIRLQ